MVETRKKSRVPRASFRTMNTNTTTIATTTVTTTTTTNPNVNPTNTTMSSTTAPTTSSTLPLSTLIQHKLLHKNTSVLKFSGNVGTTTADVEAYIESVENHLASLSLANDHERLTEAKLYLDYSRGDLKINCQSAEFRKIATWSGLKTYLRTIYGQVDRKDPPVSLSKILRDLEKSDGYYRGHMATVFLKTNEFTELLGQTNWVTPDRTAITLENLQTLLYLSLGLLYLPEPISNAVRDKWEPTDGFSMFTRRIEEAFRNCPNIDTHKLVQNNSQLGSNSHTVSFVQKTSKPPARNTQNPQMSGSSRISREKKNLTCYKCKKIGHTSPECRSKPRLYCAFHKTTTHNTVDCRDKPMTNQTNQRRIYKPNNFQPNNFQHKQINTFRNNPRTPNQPPNFWHPNQPHPDFSQPQPSTYQPQPHPPLSPNFAPEHQQYQPYPYHYRRPQTQQNTINQITQNDTLTRETIDPTVNFQEITQNMTQT